MKKILLIIMIVSLLIPFKIPMAYKEFDYSRTSENDEDFPYPKLDDLMKELKEKRKQIEQQRLEEIKAKKIDPAATGRCYFFIPARVPFSLHQYGC